MENMYLRNCILLLFVTILLTSCPGGGSVEDIETEYSPIFMSRWELERSIRLEGAKEIRNYGKIYRKDHLLFINEKYEGIHIVDNSDPANPEKLGFINIPGNVDIAMKNNFIYADNSVDLVTLEYKQDAILVVDRERSVFPEFTPPDGGSLPDIYYSRPDNSVLIKWTKE